MIENKQLYAYIVNSLDVLNKSLLVNEQNTVKLFSYLYNNQNNINTTLTLLNKNHVDWNTYKNIDKHIDELEKYILRTDSKIKKLENKITQLENDKKDPIVIEVPVMVQDNFNIFIRIWLFIEKMIYQFFNSIYHLYNKCYRYIFREKIKRELEEQEHFHAIQEAEKRKRENEERKKQINDILNKPRRK